MDIERYVGPAMRSHTLHSGWKHSEKRIEESGSHDSLVERRGATEPVCVLRLHSFYLSGGGQSALL